MQKLSQKVHKTFKPHEQQTSEPKSDKSVKDALAELQDKIDAFQKEVDYCNQARLGRIETNQQDLEQGLSLFASGNMRKRLLQILLVNRAESHFIQPLTDAIRPFTGQLGVLKQSLESLREQVGDHRSHDSQFLMARFMDVLYQLLTSHPNFNSKTGGGRF